MKAILVCVEKGGSVDNKPKEIIRLVYVLLIMHSPQTRVCVYYILLTCKK
jgi:hypothetical protein